jgi:6-pyruvoyltetrahydropterin/6-carboxytetrahydropterin synthase
MIAHSLPDPFFGPAQGLHGATLVVEVTWRRRELTDHGVVMDIGRANDLLSDVLDPLRYANLDEHPAFAGTLSTTERIATHLSDALRSRVDETDFSGLDVLLREHPDAWASCSVDFERPDRRS